MTDQMRSGKPKEVVLHVGAHKTGTTFLQAALGVSGKTLGRAGLSYLCRESYAKVVGRSFRPLDDAYAFGEDRRNLRRQAVDTMRAWAEDILGRVDTPVLLLSNEDFSGNLLLHRYDRLYPVFEERMDALMEVFRDCRVRFCFSIAPQDEFLESAALQVLQQGMVSDPLRVVQGAPVQALSWIPMISHLDTLVGPENVCLLSKKMRKVSSGEMTRQFVRFANPRANLDGLDFQSGASAANPSLSVEGVEIAKVILKAGGVSDWMQVRRFLQETYPATRETRPVLLDEATRRKIRERYEGEMQDLEARMEHQKFHLEDLARKRNNPFGRMSFLRHLGLGEGGQELPRQRVRAM